LSSLPSLCFSHLPYRLLRRKGVARRNVVDSKAVAPAMLGAATFPHTVLLLLPRETLRLALKIDHLKIAQLRIALRKAARKKAGPKRHVPKKATPKRVGLKKIAQSRTAQPPRLRFSHKLHQCPLR